MNVTAKNFDKELEEFGLTMATMKRQAHNLAVFVIAHTKDHGNPTKMNALFNKLTPGMQASFKRYIAMVCCEEEGNVKSSWITMSKGNLVVNPLIEERKIFFGYGDDRKEVTIDELQASRSFLEIDPDKVKNIFNDDAILKAIKTIVAKAAKENAEVSEEVKKALESAETAISLAHARAVKTDVQQAA